MAGTGTRICTGQYRLTENYLKEHVPGIGMIRPQASYLVFLDCRALGLPQEKLARLFAEKAHLALNDGTMFGKPGERLYAVECRLSPFGAAKALEQLSAAVKEEMARDRAGRNTWLNGGVTYYNDCRS